MPPLERETYSVVFMIFYGFSRVRVGMEKKDFDLKCGTV